MSCWARVGAVQRRGSGTADCDERAKGVKSIVGTMGMKEATLPWHRPFHGRRCRARLAHGTSHGYHGRCDLIRNHDGVHALERGMEIVRFR